MALIGSAYVEIRALDTNLQRDIDNAMKKIKDVTLKLQTDLNLAPVRKKIQELRAEVASDPLRFAVEIEDDKIVESLAEAHQLYEDNPLNIVTHTDTTQIQTALQTVQEQFREMPSTVTANANTVKAEAQLATVARRRTANIFAKLNIAPDIEKAIKGIGYTIAGAIPADKVRASVTGVLANFESIAIGAAKAVTVIGSVGAMALTTGANILTMGADIGRTIGLLNTAPAVFTAMGLAMVSLQLGFKDFGAAFSDDAKKAGEALAKLPKQAQEAVKAMKGLGAEIRKDSQGAFWEEMGTALQDTVKTAFPIVKKGMHDISIATAKMTKGMLASFKELAENGGMETLFTNIDKGLTATSHAVKPFFDAMNTISVTGSKHLERYGTKLTAVAERFDAWATRVSESGEMDQWITQAGANMENLGKIVGETVNVFKGLTQAAAASGGKGLADLAEGMKNFAGIINSEPFQSKLILILQGAREGVKALGEGFDDIKRIISNGTTALSGFLTLAGQIGGSFMSNIAAMFDGTGLGAGLIEAMDGAKQAMDLMKPAFSDFGTMLGDIGEIASVLFVNMAPGINNLADTLQKIVAGLKKGVEDVIPVLNIFIQNILMVIAPIIVGIAGAIGKLLEGFAALPEIVRNAIMALGLFLLALKMLDRPMRNVSTGVRDMASPLQRMKDGIAGVRDTVSKTWNTNGSIGAVRTAMGGLVGTASVTAGAIGKSFSQIGWMAQHSASAIGEGFKRTFSQMGDQMKKLGTPVKEFGSMMGKVMGEALFPSEVRDGFRNVGTKLADVARIYTGYFTAAKDKIAAIGRGLANVFPANMLGPALKALPGEVGKALAFAGQKVTDGVTNIAKTLAGPAVGFAMGKLRETIQAQSAYASKHLENIGKGLGTAVAAVKAAPAVVGAALGNMANSAKSAFGSIQQSVTKAFNATVLAAAINPMTAPFVKMADAAKTAATTALGHMTNMAKSIGTAINTMTVPARAAFAGLAVAASLHAGVIADKFKNAASTVAGNFTTAFRNAGTDLANVGSGMASAMGRAFTGIQTAATTTATHVTDAMKRASTALAANFAPAVAAVKGTFEGIAGAVRPAFNAIGDLGRSAGTAAGAVGSLAGATAKWAGSGLLNAMGGGWGLAIAGATAAITAMADAQAKSKSRVEAFSASLDQQSGSVTNLTKSLMIKSIFDGVTDEWDDFVRGVVDGSKTVAETLSDLEVDTKKYADTMADPTARTKYIKGMEEVEKNLRSGQQTSDELATSLGMSTEALTGLSAVESIGMANSLQHARIKAEDMAKELKRAEDQIKLVATATGKNSAEAAILSKNYDILSNSTSSVSDKFSAFRENLRLIGTDQEKAALGQKGYQQSLRDTATKIKEIGEANVGILLPSLFEVGKGFDFTKQAGADLHSALDQQVQGIQMLGTEAIQKAIAEGKKGEDVQRAALNAMQPAIDALKANLKDLGFNPEQIQGILEMFNLMPKDITTAISVTGAEAARKEIALTALAAGAYARGDYSATLAALPQAAKDAIELATGEAGAFARKDYTAILNALDKTEGGKEGALANLLTVVDGKWEAELTAMDLTKEPMDAAMLRGQELADSRYIAKLDADNLPFTAAKQAAETGGTFFAAQTYTSKMASDNAAFDAGKAAADASGGVFDKTTFTSKMAADNAAFDRSNAAATSAGNTFGFTTFTSRMNGDKHPFDVQLGSAQRDGEGFAGKDFKATASVNDQASGPLSGILSALGSIGGFVAEATVNVRKFFTGESAEGSINDGQNWNPKFMPKINAYANGGIENHIAQIAKPSNTVRIWAERETGGEAYIPLSKAKRPRSLRILEEVADQFGFSLVKRLEFANGGFFSGIEKARSPAISSSAQMVVTSPQSATQTSPETVVNFTVNPSQGLSESQIGEAAMRELYWQIASR